MDDLIESHAAYRLSQVRYDPATQKPSWLGIDEIFWRGQAITVIADIRHGPHPEGVPVSRVIDILPSRDPEILAAFLRRLDQEVSSALGSPWRPVIASDMWGDFRLVIRQVFGGRALHVADRFHVAAKILVDLKEAVSTYHTVQLLSASDRKFKTKQEKLLVGQVANRLTRGYQQALKEDQNVPAFSEKYPADADLLQLAVRLNSLWSASRTQREAIDFFQDWVRRVRNWETEYARKDCPVRAFGRLIHLLDQEGWILEVTNTLRPEARLTTEVIADVTHLRAPEARPPENRFASTARVEQLNRQIRDLERYSPNHRRNPYAGTDWRRWNEEGLFIKYRQRLLHHLNGPPRGRATYAAQLHQPVNCPNCDERLPVPGPARWRKVYDLPLGSSPVQLTYQETTWTCLACGTSGSAAPEVTDGITTRLHLYLQRALGEDITLLELQRRTRAPRQLINELVASLPEPDQARLPRHLGAVTFFWRGLKCVLVTELKTGKPVALLRHDEEHFTPACFRAWLTGEYAADVREVWVETEEWLPRENASSIRYAFDTFATSRIIQRCRQALRRDFTAPFPVPARRTPAFKDMARVLTASRQPKYHMLTDRIYRAERERKREWAMLNPVLNYGDGLLQQLEELLIHQPSDEAIDAWLVEAGDRKQAAESGLTKEQFQQITGALSAIVQKLKPGSATRSAILAGAYFSKQRAERPENAEGQLPQLDQSRTVRTLKDIRDLRVFKSRSPYAWKRLRWIALGGSHE
ncbi:hypothetical protein Dxin01_03726 [Deinococcus xinjiangensis]|uniref:Transposase IS204/IS1001/IS1096/IS1165 DDE domain-containing protein n=1 Tax=Deinococcus xinjiangensis TaxID=457454 RepID=A0ABP9VIN7_9DEIO